MINLIQTADGRLMVFNAENDEQFLDTLLRAQEDGVKFEMNLEDYLEERDCTESYALVSLPDTFHIKI